MLNIFRPCRGLSLFGLYVHTACAVGYNYYAPAGAFNNMPLLMAGLSLICNYVEPTLRKVLPYLIIGQESESLRRLWARRA
jgi:hypothetical protein